MVCAGNSSEYCGGPNRLSLYNYTQTLPTSPGTGGGSSTVFAVKTGLSGNWTYEGCYIDNANGRILGNELDSASTTVESCIANCASQNFTIAGIEYSTQCCEQPLCLHLQPCLTPACIVCGDYLISGATVGSESSCNMACGGNAT